MNEINLPRTLTLNLHLALFPDESCVTYITVRVPIFTFQGKVMYGLLHNTGDLSTLSVTFGIVQLTLAYFFPGRLSVIMSGGQIIEGGVLSLKKKNRKKKKQSKLMR